jgi:hypothetical protein
MNEKQMQQWKTLRKQGKITFIIKKGLIQWGVLTALLFSVLMHFVQPEYPIWLRPLISLIIFPFGGIFYGLWVWAIGEKKYQKFLSAQESNT